MGSLYLYDSTSKEFESQGLGKLKYIADDKVEEQRNGEFFLEFTVFNYEKLFKNIKNGNRIKCDAAPNLKDQIFEIVKVTKTSNKRNTVYAEHVSYITKHLTMKSKQNIKDKNADQALKEWHKNIVDENPITTYSNIATVSSSVIEEDAMENARQALGGVRGSLLQTYKGEYLFDNYKISLLGSRGTKRNVIISYGRNLLSLQQDDEIESVHTSIQPFAKTQDGEKETLIKLPEHYIDGPTVKKFTHRRILKVDFSEKMGEKDGVDKLRKLANQYIKDNKVGYPKISISVEHFDLSQSVEYKDVKGAEELNLCDEVTIRHDELDIDIEAKIVKTVYSPVSEKYLSLEIGETKYSLSEHINNIEHEVAEISKDYLSSEVAKQIIDFQTDLITGNKGGSMIIRYSEEGKPNEILFMDTENVNTAKEVLRMNRKGIGFSTKGAEGPFDTAWTLNGVFNASYITTGILKGPKSWWNLMTGEINFEKGKIIGSNSSWNLDTGEIKFNKGKITGGSSSWNLDTGVMNFTKGKIKGEGKNDIELNIDKGELISKQEYGDDGTKYSDIVGLRVANGQLIVRNETTGGHIGKLGGVRYVEGKNEPSGMAIGAGYNYQTSIGKMMGTAATSPIYPAIQVPVASKPDGKWEMIFYAKVKDVSGTLSVENHIKSNVSSRGVFPTFATYSKEKNVTSTGTILVDKGRTYVDLCKDFCSISSLKNVQVTPDKLCMFAVQKESDGFYIECSEDNISFDWTAVGESIEKMNKSDNIDKNDIEQLYSGMKEE